MDDLFNIASSSLIAQRLSNFKFLPTISQHQFTSFIVFPLSRQKLSNLYVAERAFALLVLGFKSDALFCLESH